MSLIGKSIYHVHGVNQLKFGTVVHEKHVAHCVYKFMYTVETDELFVTEKLAHF